MLTSTTNPGKRRQTLSCAGTYLDIGWRYRGVHIPVSKYTECALLTTTTDRGEAVLAMFLMFRKLFRSPKPLLHMSTQCPGTSLHMTSLTRPSLHYYVK